MLASILEDRKVVVKHYLCFIGNRKLSMAMHDNEIGTWLYRIILRLDHEIEELLRD